LGIKNESITFCRHCDTIKLNQYCKSSRGDVFRIESSWRSFDAQNRLYYQSRFVPNVVADFPIYHGYEYKGGPDVTMVKGGDSFHNWGLAVDLIFTRTGYEEAFYNQKTYAPDLLASLYEDTGLVDYAKALGLVWSGRDLVLPDVAHFECYKLPLKELRDKENLARTGWWDDPSMTNKNVNSTPVIVAPGVPDTPITPIIPENIGEAVKNKLISFLFWPAVALGAFLYFKNRKKK